MGLDLHDVKIVNDGYRVKNVFVDGKEMKGITKITYTEDVESISSVIIEMFVNKLEIEDCNEKETQKQKLWCIIYKIENELGIYESFTDYDNALFRFIKIRDKAKEQNWRYEYFLKECEVEL